MGMEICGNCGGHGKVVPPDYNPHGPGPDTVPCPACGGEGWIRVPEPPGR